MAGGAGGAIAIDNAVVQVSVVAVVAAVAGVIVVAFDAARHPGPYSDSGERLLPPGM